MCDTLYKKMSDGYLFAKNSDRSPNEPNLTLAIPPQEHKDEKLACTYITIPQVNKTYGCIIVRPSWTWGAEMGINDQGVAIGNEAVFTRSKGKDKPSLIGMDYVRLGLERAKSARAAVDIITKLMGVYSQGGNCGFDKPFYYDNSYLIADRNEAWVLETAGNNWVAKTLTDLGNISNRLSIHKEATRKKGNIPNDFFKDNVEPIYSFFSCSKERQAQGEAGLRSLKDNDLFELRDLMRSHHPKDQAKLFTKGSIRSLCMHYSLLGDHTTSSMVIRVAADDILLFLTSASTPCLRLFKPVVMNTFTGVVFKEEQEAFSYWLNQEKITRLLYAGVIDEKDYRQRLDTAQLKIDNLVKDYLNSPEKHNQVELVVNCVDIEKAFIKPYSEIVDKYPEIVSPKRWFAKNQKLGIHVFDRNLMARLGK